MVKIKKQLGFDEEGMKLPEEVRDALEILIRDTFQDFLQQKERQERLEGEDK